MYYRRLSGEQPGPAEVGYHVTADDRVVESWQNPSIGDVIADGPPGTAYYVVRQTEPDEILVLCTDRSARPAPGSACDTSRPGQLLDARHPANQSDVVVLVTARLGCRDLDEVVRVLSRRLSGQEGLYNRSMPA